jgi:Lon-like ATP-dependent protease
VHDPIYQGAGAYGAAGVPQPKIGAVTKAHGGILFIDEIGELHPIQINKLLKVLEDRKVFLESAYYSSEDRNIPLHIHDIFQRGLPADFRLIGATTKSPEDIPYAIRSRCIEVFFKPLQPAQLALIGQNAVAKSGMELEKGCDKILGIYGVNGRETVSIAQLAAGIAISEKRNCITKKDIEWVIRYSRYTPNIQKNVVNGLQVGIVNGLAVQSGNIGIVIDIEVEAIERQDNQGKLVITGIIEQEEYNHGEQKMKKMSSAQASVKNALTVLKRLYKIFPENYLPLHIIE